ncbi:DCC1-like thiol-disulfide oxidoreductase family protein [Bacteroidia bacterium]|nr:DCC1-like thiol-disulfide oxidoreductase family protein [Bacteroidia bacterium]
MNNIVLFDGVCNLCNRSVDFIIRNQKSHKLQFASLQSDVGKSIVNKSGLDEIPDSVMLYVDGKLLVRSDAALAISTYLKRPYVYGIIFKYVPKILRDSVYNLIAKNRYRWFGKKETCRVPSADERERFLG